MGGTRRRIVIVGAGPAGLSFARALADTPAEITLIERAPLAALAEPRFDGREIALTHRSERALRDLDAWSRIPAADIHRLDRAEVLSGRARFAMRIDPDAGDVRPLGHLVSNHLLRRALFESVAGQANMDLRARYAVERVQAGRGGVTVTLADGAVIEADLLVAADSRFSAIRDQLGIGADVRPVGKTMLVGRVGHAPCQVGVATEWFARHHTLAMLPLGEGLSSAVITLTPEAAEAFMAESGEAKARRIAAMTRGRWGALALASDFHAYPLTTTFAHRFAAPRAVLIGDAAVGMHPVTAHGFNFGLAGAVRLAKLLASAEDVGDPRRLARYAAAHRAETWPLFQATRAIVGLFTDDRHPAMALRHAALRLGALPPVRMGLRTLLMQQRDARAA
ncbi:5-demethoxyubiquinol-8 5-hydroxylase UbiM [Sphingopyxis sp.]|uniref:5-demethoxyubiquinol-8 5-hydroxylase UbiM n=1 Tax=Sphingopyxis sp. TaxID=1908224 RepID=UPI002582E188|nr:5-demethoxyubiquinol-8 5-hydroxylase UbiM [Sphingopyxis sp.]